MLQQQWQEEIDLGFHNSGEVVTIEVVDSDSGLEFGDDLLYSVDVRVPWCSAFHANATTADCGEEYAYNCDVQVCRCSCSVAGMNVVRKKCVLSVVRISLSWG